MGYFVEAGITFQTAAGDQQDFNSTKPGKAFLSIRYVFTQLDSNTMEVFFDNRKKPQGMRMEAGVLVKERINHRLSYFEATQGRSLPTLYREQQRLGMDYRLAREVPENCTENRIINS
ncbi:MAG: hypothetical protein ACJAQ4_002368 [Cryomorphaceae bacterium]